MQVEEIETPALLVDLSAMESNLLCMANFFANRKCRVRPHFKNHKVLAFAFKQLDSGAVGITCATLREAEILADHGITDILIANEIVGTDKLEKLAGLLRRASVVVAVDNEKVLGEMALVQKQLDAKFEIVIDVNIGLNRCGVPPGEPAVALARSAISAGINVRGIMGYDGHFQAQPPGRERDGAVLEASRTLLDSAALIAEAGIPMSIVSTGGTGTYSISGSCEGITDIQAGSYLLMDTRYKDLGAPFHRSLTVLSTVISMRDSQHAVIDCGLKEMSGERGLPALKDQPCAKLTALHAEHALIEIDPHSSSQIGSEPTVGKKIEVWVQYSDATVNLHSRMYGVRNGQIEEIFRIEH
jgi:D-serine deaminase-like pyridoxal phosphate-dependent protein